MKNLYDIVRAPLITEKGALQTENNKYHFEVAVKANKKEVKDAIEAIYNVTVTKVNMINVPGKNKRVGRYQGKTATWKKAIVTVKPGDSIDYL